MHPADDPAAAQGDAERAFRDLRDEVAGLRQVIAGAVTAPDYSPTLGAIAKELQTIAKRLAAIESHPALKLTPEQHAREIRAAGTTLMHDAAHNLDRAAQAAERERDRLADLVGTARRQDEQRRWLLGTGLAAFLLGLLAVPVLAGLLPFGLDSAVAALVMRNDRWHAGSALMAEADPDGWNELAAATDLAHDNETALKACRAAAQKTGREQRCTVSVPAP